MLGAGDNVKLLDHRPPQPVLRKHASNSFLDRERGLLREQVFVKGARDPARVSRVAPSDFLLLLAAGEHHLGRVDDDQVVSDVHVRGEDRLVLPAEDHRGFRGDTPEDLVAGVHDVPTAFDVLRLG